LPGKNDYNNMYVPVSLLNNGVEQLKVAHDMYVDSKASWEVIGDSDKQHTQAFGK